ncbi:MAG: hypothetical protein U0703_00260 [Anaerolineae bacterium]
MLQENPVGHGRSRNPADDDVIERVGVVFQQNQPHVAAERQPDDVRASVRRTAE